MKKISLLAATAATIMSAEAATCNPSGFFVGLNAGMQMTGAKLRFDNNITPGNDRLRTDHINTDFGHKNADFVAELMAGYNMLYSGVFVLGIHVYIGYNDTSMKHRTSMSDVNINDERNSGFLVHKLKRSNDFFYGIGLRLGYLLNARTILSIMLNAERTKWKLTGSTEGVPSEGGATNANTGNESFSKSKSRIAFAPAIELATFITKQVSINLRYKCVFGPSIKLVVPGQNRDATGKENTPLRDSTSKAKVREHQVTIGVSYKTN